MSTPSKYDVPVSSTTTGTRGIQLPPEITAETKDTGNLDSVGEYVQNLVTNSEGAQIHGGQTPASPSFTNGGILSYEGTIPSGELPANQPDQQPKGPDADYVYPQFNQE